MKLKEIFKKIIPVKRIKCPVCGHEMLRRTGRCPHCGTMIADK